MNMIKKIALTASILLFVLAQVFSFYVIYISHQEKTALLKEHEGRLFARSVNEFGDRLLSAAKRGQAGKNRLNIAIYCFRNTMPSQSALYLKGEELYNSSRYEFAAGKLEEDAQQYPCNYRLEKQNGHYLQVFYATWGTNQNGLGLYGQEEYLLVHVVDITDIYIKSFYLILKELLVAFCSSVGMGLLLMFLIKKITRPLQAVNETQRQLIGSLSHELKTPLTAIRGYSETLSGVKLSKDQEEKALLYINRESARLSRLFEKMMELTRLYEPECRITLREISVEKLFDAVKESVEHRLLEKGMTLVFEGDLKERKKVLDEDLMISFLINLINNSIMASKEGGQIYIGADAHSIWVRDEGCGIAKEELEKVKKAFYRVDKSRSRKSGNMGLGLALCEQIAAVHKGKMEIESTVGTGTKVAFTDHLH
ncbi:MAG: HAMP domain-containing histidine kinase [Eubacterium sp.]|nr:HAMP domain-containing histidine kinase [Eubacterium sp.]